MGDFKGHALASSFFIIFGLWWSVKYPLKYHSKRLYKNSYGKYFNYLEIIEGAVKLVFSVIGMLGVQFSSGTPHLRLYGGNPGRWVDLMDWQHTTMYMFLGISGAVDIFTYSSVKVPMGLDRLMFSIANFVEGFLLYYHGSHQLLLVQHVHSLLLTAAFAGAASNLLEVFLRDNIVLELFRTSLLLLQGTWFFQIGLVLFPPWGGPRWDVEDNNNVTFTSICFCWHYATAILVLGLNYALVLWCIQKFGESARETDIRLRMQKQQCEKDYHAALLNGSDDE